MKVICFGELLADMTGMEDRKFQMNAGGAPANCAVAVKKAGAESALVAKVGADLFGSYLVDTLESEGVNCDNVKVSRKDHTTLAFVRLEKGEREFSFYRLADKEITEEEVERIDFSGEGIFHFGSLSLSSEGILKSTLKAIASAKKAGWLVSFDVNYRANLWSSAENARSHILSVLPLADVVKVSEEEATFISGIGDPFDSCYGVMERGVPNVVLTMGEQGSLFVNKDLSVAVNGLPAKVVDTTGAGDCFYGTFLAQIAKRGGFAGLTEAELSEILLTANVAGAIAVEGYGAIPSYPTAEQVQARKNNR